MKIPPKFKITQEILELIAKIEAHRIFFTSISIPLEVKENIQRISLLKSSLFSARIEGNPLTIEEIELSSDKKKKLEVFNILKAMKWIDREIKPTRKITKKHILGLHKIVMKDLFATSGFFRKEAGAIFNQAGIAVYMSPPPSYIPKLTDGLLSYVNSKKERFPLINALIAHLVFEKIHPFLDGNGRVGRLFIFAVLKAKDWLFPINIPLEEYLDEHKEDYYYFLDVGLKKTEDYLRFMLQAFYEQTEKIKTQVLLQMKKTKTLLLPPRQEEIYNIIKDHQVVSFDRIKRRFLKVPERTLRYDLKKLQEKKLIIKIGVTRGSFYKSVII